MRSRTNNDIQSEAESRRNIFAPGTLQVATASLTDLSRAFARPSDMMIDISPSDWPSAAAVAVAAIIWTVDVEVGLMVSRVSHCVFLLIH